MTREEWIFQVVDSFYEKAKSDILIGYHFRNIKDFDEHIPRIAAFWELQLLGASQRKIEKPFDVVNLHNPLGIKKGELGRWVLLFRRTLDEKLATNNEFAEMGKLWNERITFFEGVFSRFLGL